MKANYPSKRQQGKVHDETYQKQKGHVEAGNKQDYKTIWPLGNDTHEVCIQVDDWLIGSSVINTTQVTLIRAAVQIPRAGPN